MKKWRTEAQRPRKICGLSERLSPVNRGLFPGKSVARSSLVAVLILTAGPSLRPSRTALLTFSRSRRSSGGSAITASWISVDLAEINHACQVTGRSTGGLPPKAKIETLQAELAKLEAAAGGHRADFEWERDQGHKLMAEFLKMIAVTMTAKEATARLEGELAALKARPWWRRLAG